MSLEIRNIYEEISENELEKIDNFILDSETNGEFINTVKYLSYHKERFQEDSIYVLDGENGTILGVVMAVINLSQKSVISHSGTTFAGPVLNMKMSFSHCSAVMEAILDYYESKYERIDFRITPEFYSRRECGVISYILLERGYQYGMTALANVIDLFGVDGEDEVLTLYDSKRRNQVRKSIKRGLFTVSKMDYVSEDIWKSMNENLHHKFGASTTHSYEEITKLLALFPENIIPYAVYSRDDEYAAFALVFKFKNVFHTQYLDVNYSFSGEYPNLFLIHYLIQEAVREKYRLFSFGASTEQGGQIINEGLFSYKQGYGGGSIILPVYQKRM